MKSGKEKFRDWSEDCMRVAMNHQDLSFKELLARGLIITWAEHALR